LGTEVNAVTLNGIVKEIGVIQIAMQLIKDTGLYR
jgi:hypothetical protein